MHGLLETRTIDAEAPVRPWRPVPAVGRVDHEIGRKAADLNGSRGKNHRRAVL